jgi:hypothetical protein
MYVYIRSEPGLFTVGHYDPDGKWIAESDYDNTDDAARRVASLNGATQSKETNTRTPMKGWVSVGKDIINMNQVALISWDTDERCVLTDGKEEVQFIPTVHIFFVGDRKIRHHLRGERCNEFRRIITAMLEAMAGTAVTQ